VVVLQYLFIVHDNQISHVIIISEESKLTSVFTMSASKTSFSHMLPKDPGRAKN